MQFERYEKAGHVRGGRPFISVQKPGAITFNNASFDLLGEPEAVELLFSQTERAIGLRGVSPKEPHSYKVHSVGAVSKHTGRPSGYVIHATAFTRYYDLRAATTMRYLVELRGDVLVAVLSEGIDASRNNIKQSA